MYVCRSYVRCTVIFHFVGNFRVTLASHFSKKCDVTRASRTSQTVMTCHAGRHFQLSRTCIDGGWMKKREENHWTRSLLRNRRDRAWLKRWKWLIIQKHLQLSDRLTCNPFFTEMNHCSIDLVLFPIEQEVSWPHEQHQRRQSCRQAAEKINNTPHGTVLHLDYKKGCPAVHFFPDSPNGPVAPAEAAGSYLFGAGQRWDRHIYLKSHFVKIIFFKRL